MRHEVCVHRIDCGDRIIFVNRSWLSFAIENSAPELNEQSVINRPLWDFIYDKETRHLYRILVEGVRRDLTAAVVPFRCDGPDRIRVMEMRIIPFTDGKVQFDCRLLREKARERVRLLDPGEERSDEFVVICGWCKKVRLPDNRWVEVEEAVAGLGLFAMRPLPNLTHGICGACRESVFAGRKNA